MNLELAAFVLSIYAAHWEGTKPEWSIRDRPEILATLYQIGFEHSYPKPNPQPNEFGLQVAEEMQASWIVEAFPTRQ